MAQTDPKKVQYYVNELTTSNPLKATWSAQYVFDKLKQGKYLHEIIGGIDIPVNYIQPVYDYIKNNNLEERLYGKVLYNGSVSYKQDKPIKETGLKDLLAKNPQATKAAISDAQRKHLNALKRDRMVYDLGKDRYVTPEEQGGDIFKSDEQKKAEEEESKQILEEAEKNQAETGESSEQVAPEQAGEGSEQTPNLSGESSGTKTAFAAAEGTGQLATEAAATEGATIVAAEGAATSSTAAGIWAAITAGSPVVIIGLIIIAIVGIVFVFMTIGNFSGKKMQVQTKPYENRGNIQTTLAASKSQELTKALDENIDEFIKKIENIKKSASGDKKAEIEKLCDEILKDANDLKSKSDEQKLETEGVEASQRDAQAKIKGEKTALKEKIKDDMDKLMKILFSGKLCVKYLNQIEVSGNMANWGCGYTSAAMVAQSFGYNISPLQVADGRSSGIPSAGYIAQKLTQLSGLNWKQASNWEDIINQVKNGNPVIVGTTFSRNSGHWMVIVGFMENGDVIVNDPYGNHGYKYTGSYQSSGGNSGEGVVYNIKDFRAHFDYDGSAGYSAYLENPPVKLFCK